MTGDKDGSILLGIKDATYYELRSEFRAGRGCEMAGDARTRWHRLSRASLGFPVLILSLLTCAVAHGEVVRAQVDRREPFASGKSFGSTGPYERLFGKLFLEVDPLAPANGRVVDLKLAPRNARGRVEFWTDFFLLKPVDPNRGNRRLFYDVNNRGNKLALGAFNNRGGNDPKTEEDAGNGFLFRQGYWVLWCGWNGDVLAGGDRLQIGLPVATENGKPITGRIHAEICVNEKTFNQPFAWGNTDPYPTVSLDNATAELTMRPRRSAEPVEVPRDQWAFARMENGQTVPDPKQLYLKEGFRPGWLYDLVYTAKDPRVTGLGFAAVRDAVSYFRHQHELERAYIFGISQSGRFIQHFLFEGFNADEQNRIVFDGALPHVGGGGRGYFNHRFAQTTRHGSQHEDNLSPSDVFPFSSTQAADPVTNETGDVFERVRKAGKMPKVIYTETSTEYWARAASLLHTDVEGNRDMPFDPNVRLYVIAGAQHGVAGSSNRGIYQNPVNVLDHRPILRAALTILDDWVTNGREPPESQYPRVADRTLVSLDDYLQKFPRIPGSGRPEAFYVPTRLDFGPRWKTEGIADYVPPHVGPAFRTLVPATDADGNDVAGIRLPEIAVPLATFTGWNPRGAEAGAKGALGRWSGSYLPFARTAEERKKTGDPRPATRERYPTRDVYLSRVADAAISLQRRRFLLDEDVVSILRTAAAERYWEDDR